nr:MAG TPA: hypothetical protein [Caudoviricetes sp.]
MILYKKARFPAFLPENALKIRDICRGADWKSVLLYD